ncbi:hypothetical protein PRIPAC_83074 [Pristionchus pacificus]|uniref:Uncharacterized protein n=1 Tax=Pristionchus pacificus TaxID=54126 RepID=A0A2A6CMY0_PRIPA|nr:hypothetical protein PRIPAC_83074 [Pristionchus pacificus]|eukprot:PDM79469.1 hypothetical protein PRIPAC_32048 [Pristionchus pacificus]
MPVMKELLAITAYFAAVCFVVEEQSIVPLRTYKVTTRVQSYRLCILYCEKDTKVAFELYGAGRAVPFRRFVKANENCLFHVNYNSDTGQNPHSFISGFCAEENPDDECCPALPPYTTAAITGRSAPRTSGQGACPGQTLYATLYRYTSPFTFNGNDAKLFCAVGFSWR